MILQARRLAHSTRFQNVILGVIVLNAALMGIETSAAVMARWGGLLHGANAVIQAIFVVEIAIRLLAHWPRPGAFFRDGWNLFDFGVVALSFLPASGGLANVARLARLLRAVRLVSAVPELRLIVGTMLKSIPSMGHVIALLALLLYVYGIIGFYLFGRTDPGHWGSLGRALMTLFKILTLEGWIEIQAASLAHHPWAWVFYASYIVVAVFVVVNLFIAVVLNNLESARKEEAAAAMEGRPAEEILARLGALRAELDAVEEWVRSRGPRERVTS